MTRVKLWQTVICIYISVCRGHQVTFYPPILYSIFIQDIDDHLKLLSDRDIEISTYTWNISPKWQGALPKYHCCSVARSCLTLCDPMDCSVPGSPILHSNSCPFSLLEFMSIESMMLSNCLILGHPVLLLPLIFPSIRIFFSEWLFTSGCQSIRASVSASVRPVNI